MPARNKLTRPAPRLGDIFPAPRLGDIFIVFLRMGAMSFGGGMTSWTRREVVERRG
jgi:chromate transporter